MFDGDEMNVHIAQSIQARNELRRIANVALQIIGAKDSNPIIGCVQDALSGAYLLTLPDVRVKGSDVANFLCNTSSDTKFEIDMDRIYTGHEIFSYIIPKGINTVQIKNDKKTFEIVDGQLTVGKLDKSTLSKVKNSIIHFIWDKYGPNKTRRFIDDSQRLVLSFLAHRGFTIGLGDTISTNQVYDLVKQMTNNKINEYNVLLTQYENDIDQLDPAIVENILRSDLNAFSVDIGNTVSKTLDSKNNLFVMMDSKSKGSIMNVQHMMCCVGQKTVEGSRIKKKVENRSLPIFHRDDDTPEARGFIKSSFVQGVNTYEYFYDAMAGREGLIDTAIKSVTWETPIIIIENNECKYTEIGKWIDNLLDNDKVNVQHFDEKQMELLDTKNIYIPTTDYQGNVSWGEVSAITRHDPTEKLYEIKTKGGRNVTVTDSKSLLIWNNETKEFKEVLTPEIKIGDCVPVTLNLPELQLNIKTDSSENLENLLLKDNKTINNYLTKIIKNNTINLNSIKERNLIGMLLSRVSIKHYFDANNIILNDDVKSLNDVVLDEISEINLVDVTKHPKVYDLTIPTTFNFGLANGLQVRDTAKTGYIQRQLIKGLEDLSIKYDMTNRNSKNVIIQYVYGENGIEQSKQTMLPIDMLGMNNEKINEVFGFSADEIKKLESKLKEKDLSKLNKNYIERIITYRNNMRDIQQLAHNNYKVLEEKYFLPVNLLRITQDYSNKKEHIELSPQYIIDSIEELITSEETRLLPSLKKTDKYLLHDDRSLKYLLEIAIHNYLCPKKCIFSYGLTKTQFDNVIKDIKLNFVKALVEPGEMVGIIAAQSIGEPCSQMSVMQFHRLKVVIKNKKNNNLKLYSGEIGKLINKIIKKNPEITYNTGHENSVETDLSTLNKEYYIIGVDGKEKTHWNKISHVSKHPVNGQIVKVKTRSGRSIETTLSHSHLIRKNQTVEPILGADLKVGMRIPVAKHIDNTFVKDEIEIENKKYKLDHLFGWFIGAYLAEGSIDKTAIKITNIAKHYIDNTTAFAKLFNKEVRVRNYQGQFGQGVDTIINHKPLAELLTETCGNGSFVKKVPDFAFLAPNEFKAGLIQGYFDGDGEFICKTNYSGNFNNHGLRNNIRACSRSEQLITDIALLLNYFDIFGHIRCAFVKGSEMYELDIPSKYGLQYRDQIGSVLHKDKLDAIVQYTERDDIHDLADAIDKINGLGDIIAKCGKELKLEGQSKTYGRWSKKDSIGRRTLQKYIQIFEADENKHLIQNELNILKQASESNVIWDEIKEIEIYTPDQSIYVYDFTVPDNQTFMIDNGIIVHNTLNTKHSAGSASKSTGGVPRIEELMHYSKDIKTPQMKIYFNDDIASNKNKVNKIASYLKFLTIRELIDSAQIYFDSGSNDEISKKLKNDNVQNPFFINNQKAELSSLQLVFRIRLNMEKLHDKETTLLDIKTKFISYWTKNFSNLKNLKKNEKDIFTKITRCCILSNNDKNDQIIHIRFNMSAFNYTTLTDFLKIILDQIILKGINNINGVNMENSKRLITDKETGDYKLNDEVVVYTEGINIEKLKYIKGINMARTVCNDISTTYRLYGIEAARQTLLNEFMSTFGGDSINHNHMSVLIDMMTHTGNITSMDRHGLGKLDSDVFARASFEKTMDHFINAAIFNEKDTTNSVSSRILLGKVIPGGTGAFELLLDSEKIENSEYTKDETGGRPTFGMLEEDSLFKDIIKYGFTKSDIFMPVN